MHIWRLRVAQKFTNFPLIFPSGYSSTSKLFRLPVTIKSRMLLAYEQISSSRVQLPCDAVSSSCGWFSEPWKKLVVALRPLIE